MEEKFNKLFLIFVDHIVENVSPIRRPEIKFQVSAKKTEKRKIRARYTEKKFDLTKDKLTQYYLDFFKENGRFPSKMADKPKHGPFAGISREEIKREVKKLKYEGIVLRFSDAASQAKHILSRERTAARLKPENPRP